MNEVTLKTANGSFIGRLWRGFWHWIDCLRRAMLNLLFLVILILLLRLLLAPGEVVTIPKQATLVLKPRGAVVEQYTGTPLERAIGRLLGDEEPETQLRDLLRALEMAAGDSAVRQVLLDPSTMTSIGLAQLQELGHAVSKLRASGKKIVAYGSDLTQSQYYLSSLADEVWLDPNGLIWLEGFQYYRNYFRAGLDKLGIDVHLFRVGEYKSAAEPFIRDDMSDADRRAGGALIGDLWQQFMSDIALNRGLPFEMIDRLTQGYAMSAVERDGDLAQAALDMGLVDRLLSWPEARAELAADDGDWHGIGHEDYLRLKPRPPTGAAQIGIVVAEGAISSGEQPPGSIGAASLGALLRYAAENDDIKVVVFRINSPGGDALASEAIRREMLALRQAGKPVIVSMGNVAASGGYWIAQGADEVWANPTTITGSIGIFGLWPTIDRTLDKIGIHTDGVGTTPLAGALRIDRPLDAAAGRMIQALIERGYRRFIDLVAANRPLEVAEVEAVAGGRVWSGRQAGEHKLIDQSGGLQEAIAAAARRAGLGDDYRVRYIEPEAGLLDRWLEMSGQAAAGAIASHLGTTPLPPAAKRAADRLQRELELLAAAAGDAPAVSAHCLCAPP